ncbi:MAG TPA: adenosylcobinamide-GDP ribazoletransferase [Ideonella sp.]|nr:adenosylcobinamide-GDP ribazoletransferase [Ideonella sp.]
MIAREAGLLIAAAAFLTRLPLRRSYSEEELRRCARYFPLVGAGVGAAGAAVLLGAAAVLPLAIAVILSVITSVLVTGALHEDGLADSCDAFGGGTTREEVLRIMQDPHIGAFGALGLGLVLTLKIVALTQLPLAVLPLALICAHASSRALCVAVMWLGEYARHEGGRTRAVARGVRASDAAVALVIGLAPFSLAPAAFLRAIPAMLVAAIALYAYFRARIGGYTGDCLGAVQQTAEATCYVTLVAAL